MSFLQVGMLTALPLVTLPIIIHLLNRLRYKTVHWAAMIFLLKANRAATRRATLRPRARERQAESEGNTEAIALSILDAGALSGRRRPLRAFLLARTGAGRRPPHRA